MGPYTTSMCIGFLALWEPCGLSGPTNNLCRVHEGTLSIGLWLLGPLCQIYVAILLCCGVGLLAFCLKIKKSKNVAIKRGIVTMAEVGVDEQLL